MASESDSAQSKVSKLIFPHDIVLIVAGGQPVAIKPLERHWYRLWIRGKQPPDPIPLDHCETRCTPKKWPKKQCEHYPYRQNPGCAVWLLVLSTLIIWAALGASIFAIVRGWPFHGFSLSNDLSLPSNFSLHVDNEIYTPPPIDPNDPKSTLLVYALIFRSAPTYIAGIFVTTIIESVDLNMRFMQPFVNMFKENPAEADESILLSYITLSPLQVPLTAYDKGHYMVSWYSTLNTISPLFPIFVGGLLTVSGDDKRVRFSFSLSAYIGIMVSLVLYSISLPWAFPHPRRLLPRQFHSMADLMAFCHQARFLGSPHFNIADRRRTPTKEHMEARIRLSGDRFLFGTYYGRDTKLHLGFDVEESRAHDFGEIQRHRQVKRIEPRGYHWYHWLMREKARVATVKARTFIGPGRELGRAHQVNDDTREREVRDENGTSIMMSGGLSSSASAQALRARITNRGDRVEESALLLGSEVSTTRDFGGKDQNPSMLDSNDSLGQ